MLFETKKINLIRKILAVLQLLRTLQIGWSYFHYQNGNLLFEETFYLTITVALLILLYSGRYIVVSSLLCALIIPKFDLVLLVPSIADNLFSFMCLFFAAHHALVVKQAAIGEEIQSVRLDILYWCLFLSYGVINLLSAFVHIDDIYWQNGSAMGELLMASSISRFFTFFRDLTDSTSWFAPLMKLNTWAVLVSQMLLIPLYIFRQSRKIVIIWVLFLLFFIFGLMEVVMLPHFTVLLFVLIFFRKSTTRYSISLLTLPQKGDAMRTFLIIFYTILGLHIVLKTPVLSKGVDKIFWLAREWDTKLWLTKKMNLLGYGQPDVLNTQEIKGSSRWFTIHKKIKNEMRLIPFIDERGNRLNYYPDVLLIGNQGSDYIKKNLVAYGLHEDTFTYLNSSTPYKEKGRSETRLIKFDYSASFHRDTVKYMVRYYRFKGKDHRLGDTMTEERLYNCVNGEAARITR